MRYKLRQDQPFVLTNEGGSILTFCIKYESDSTEWLTISEQKGAILPGDSVRHSQLSITLSVLIKESEAKLAHKDLANLSLFLIVSYNGGPDTFVEVVCKSLQTSFGAKITELVKLDTAVGLLTRPIRIEALGSEVEHAVPKELWRMLKFLYTHGLHTPNLFVQSGNPPEMALIRHALDFGTPMEDSTDIHSVGAVLIEWLFALSDPVTPSSILDNYCKKYVKHGKESPNITKEFLTALPDANSRTFLFIVSFLREISQQSDDIPMSAAKLSLLFSLALTQADSHYENFSKEDLNREHMLQFHRQGFLLLFILQ